MVKKKGSDLGREGWRAIIKRQVEAKGAGKRAGGGPGELGNEERGGKMESGLGKREQEALVERWSVVWERGSTRRCRF